MKFSASCCVALVAAGLLTANLFAPQANIEKASMVPVAKTAAVIPAQGRSVAPAQPKAEPTAAKVELTAAKVPFGRRNPVTEAIAKTEAGVVAIRVPRPGETDAVGTGLLVDARGYIVTNAHVTMGKKHVRVRLHDGTDLIGEVVTADVGLDLAIVRITTKESLKALPLAPTSDLIRGETVIAIGNPFGYDDTVSIGNISGLNRAIPMPNDVTMRGVIQHTAPINPGNSGGPLLNINGEVIGVNVALRDGAQNIAFAINASTVKAFISKHLSAQRVSGIQHGLKIEEKVVAEVGDRQVVIIKTAAHEELQSGDQIKMVGSLKVNNAFDLERSLWNSKPGEQVAVTVVRQGREVRMTLTMTANDGAGQVAAVSR